MNRPDPFNVLAEPSRRALLEAMRLGSKSVSDLVKDTDMSQPVVSKHLKILRDGEFVSVEPDGQRRIYSLNLESFKIMDQWLKPYRALWSSRLDDLEAFLEQE